jgi:hypothetical protein
MATETFAGPVDFVVFAFPDGADIAEGLSAVLDSVHAGSIELLDLQVVGRDDTGAPVSLTFEDVQPGVDLSTFDGARSDVLDQEDLTDVAAALTPGRFAIALVYEDRSLAAAAAAWARTGGEELLSGGVDIADLERALGEGSDR